MKREQFIQFTKEVLKKRGYTSIEVYPNLFCTKADVYGKNKWGRRAKMKAYVIKQGGKEGIEVKKDPLDWIDEYEELDAILDD